VVRGIKGGISRLLKAPTYAELDVILPQSQRVVKVHGVSLSHTKYLASSRECQIRWNLKGDSEGIITPFVQDTNYVPRNFATLGPLELRPLFIRPSGLKREPHVPCLRTLSRRQTLYFVLPLGRVLCFC
jgi:hypothetical protein